MDLRGKQFNGCELGRCILILSFGRVPRGEDGDHAVPPSQMVDSSESREAGSNPAGALWFFVEGSVMKCLYRNIIEKSGQKI